MCIIHPWGLYRIQPNKQSCNLRIVNYRTEKELKMFGGTVGKVTTLRYLYNFVVASFNLSISGAGFEFYVVKIGISRSKESTKLLHNV